MIAYRTASGSVYHVDGLRVRRSLRSSSSRAERVGEDWREAAQIIFGGVGVPLVIVWGRGTDEHSSRAEQVGIPDGSPPLRTTVTSPVVSVREEYQS